VRKSPLSAALLAATATLGLLPAMAAPAAATPLPMPRGKVTITVHEGMDSTGRVNATAKLTCFPARGTHPRPWRACRLINRANGEFANLPASNRPCPKIYRPVTVVAYGTWQGKPTGFARTYGNQCTANAESSDVFNLTTWRR
jgi:hypothetical protein